MLHAWGYGSILLIVIGLSPFPLHAQRLNGSSVLPDTIPFTLTAFNNIMVPVVINGTDSLLLMFHSSATGVYVTKEALARTRSIHVDDTGIAHSWGGSQQADYSDLNTLRMGTLAWDSAGITIDENSGQGSDGKFGHDLFADGILEIDHDRKELIVRRSIPENMTGYSSLPLEVRDGSLYVEATIALHDTSCTDLFMFHTGYGGTCILGTDLMSHLGDNAGLDTLGVKELKDSFGHVLKNVATTAPSLTFGGSVFKDLRINVMDRRSQFTASVLGNDLLRRFNAVFDFRNGRLYVRPNASMGEPFSGAY